LAAVGYGGFKDVTGKDIAAAIKRLDE